MGLSIPLFSDTTTVSASDIRGKVDTIETFVDRGVLVGDLRAAKWVDSVHIFKPDFFASPSPRMEAVSGDTWWRQTGLGRNEYAIFHADPIVEQWIPIPGLCATIRNPISTAANRRLDLMASFYAFTIGGFPSATNNNINERRSALLSLRVNGTEVDGTRRFVYATPTSGTYAGSNVSRNQFSIYAHVAIDPGTTDIGIYINLERQTYDDGLAYDAAVAGPGDVNPDWKHTFVGTRNLVVDVHHLHS
jgi:hypothetical protein